jgi:hypothetical protein
MQQREFAILGWIAVRMDEAAQTQLEAQTFLSMAIRRID